MQPLQKGDYVLATKYRDGDPFDGWALGFFDGMLREDRFLVVNSEGRQYRANGFRRCERVSLELGDWIFKHRITIEALTRIAPINMWRFRRATARRELEAQLADPVVREQRARVAREALSMGGLREDEREALTA
jgi:hypothetical protein